MQSPSPPHTKRIGAPKRPRSEESYQDKGCNDSVFGGSLTPEPPDVVLEPLPVLPPTGTEGNTDSSSSRVQPGNTSSLLPPSHDNHRSCGIYKPQ